MNRLAPLVRKPVKRHGGEHYLLVTILSFAISVSVTRLFLALTGYPQVGSGTLHIAHLLWGGLLLFIASLLPLIYANRWILSLEAVLAGAGVGLFIDEVGKFITRTNDYFYPPAAPIIYIVFLITVLLYLRVRRQPHRDPRTELYHVLDGLEEVLDHDLDAREQSDLRQHLQYVIETAEQPELKRLAIDMLKFVENQDIYLVSQTPTILTRLQDAIHQFEENYFDRVRFRAALAGGFAGLGVVALSKLFRLVLSAYYPETFQGILDKMFAAGRLGGPASTYWFYGRLVMEGVLGVALIVAAIYMATGRERRGINIAYFSLLLSLTVIDLLIFYYDQFSTIILATIQLGLLLGALYYRERYIRSRTLPRPQNELQKTPSVPATRG